MRNLPIPALVLVLATLAAGEATAALMKYRVRDVSINQSEDISPPVDFTGNGVDPMGFPQPAAFLDDGILGSPVLRKFVLKSPPASITVELGSGAFIFVNSKHTEGPSVLGTKPAAFTGSGSLAGGSTVRWGIVTGWTITGQLYCKSVPPVTCNVGGFEEDTTGDPFFFSDFYDLGTWFFHGTGFTATPHVAEYFTVQTGNLMRWYRGFPLVDATVPALPVIGVVLLGGSLVVGVFVAFGNRRG